MSQLSQTEREAAKAFNTRARQIFWRGAVEAKCPVWNMTNDDDIVDWVEAFQVKHDLLVDGRLGPSTMIVMMANERGGLGDPIVDGKEVHIDGLRVARMFVPGADLPRVEPEMCCVLSQAELDRETRDRVRGTGGRVRAHFSIDSSRGAHGESLIIQWADPLRQCGFCPVNETFDYPRSRQCIGVEIENVLLLYQLDSDERRWLRRRPVTKAQIGTTGVSQPIIYEEQAKAFERLMSLIVNACGIPNAYPCDETGLYSTALLDGNALNGHKGFIAKYNYFQQNNEPGVGFAMLLERFFGKREAITSDTQAAAAIEMPADNYLANREAAKAELADKPEPTQSFSPKHEEDPRFNLSAAIAAAWQSGKAARGARLADRAKKFDQNV